MSDDFWDDDDEECPKCQHYPTRFQRCTEISCQDGYIDLHEFDDPMLFDEGDYELCDECGGTGILRWCPQCGYDIGRDPEQLVENENEDFTAGPRGRPSE